MTRSGKRSRILPNGPRCRRSSSTADELAVDEDLRHRGPLGKILERFPERVIREDVDGHEVLHAGGLEDLAGPRRENPLWKTGGPFHENHYRGFLDLFFDPGTQGMGHQRLLTSYCSGVNVFKVNACTSPESISAWTRR